jgi:hypothetical protein
VRRLEEIETSAWETAKGAKKAGCTHYLFTGDLCDPDKNMNVYDAVRVAQDIALWLASNQIHSHWVAGNHDVIEDGSGTTTLTPLKSLAAGGYVHVYERPDCVTLGEGVTMFVLPFVATSHPYDPTKFVVDSLPDLGTDFLIVAGHLNIEGVIPGEETHEMPRGRDVFYPLKALRLVANPKLLVNGHYHRRMKTDGGIYIPGTIARLTFGEEENHPSYSIYGVRNDNATVAHCPIGYAHEMLTVDLADKRRNAIPEGGRRFVRIKPTEDSTDEDVENAKRFWDKNSQSVKVLPKPRAKVVLNDQKKRAAKKTTVRETVLTMAAEANSQDNARLLEVVEETLAKVGE